MKRTALIYAFAGYLLMTAWVRPLAQCRDTEQDRLVYARERLFPGVPDAQLRLVYQWLLNSTKSCPLSGDLWYLRSLVAQKVGDSGDATYASGKATENNSAAKAKGFDPWAGGSHAAAPMPGKPGQKFALLVGVQDMQYSNQLLQFADRDARDMKGFLVDSAGFPEDNVTVLVGDKATTQGIREAFGTIRTRAKPEDLVLIYFSSHGQPRNLDPTGLSYVLTYDTDTRTPAKVFSTALQMVELAELGRWVQARDYVLLLDTCYSGAARAGVAVAGTTSGSTGLDPLQGLTGSGNRIVISASRADEVSYEDQSSRHGYFTRFLLEALGKNPSPQSMKAVYDYVSSHVADQVAQTSGHQQHPVMQAFGGGGEIVINRPPPAAAQAMSMPDENSAFPAQRPSAQ